MQVKRIVANIAASDLNRAAAFYHDILGLDQLMDLGWIQTFGSTEYSMVEISIASQGGSRAPVPDISIEVDDLDEALQRVQTAGILCEYGPAKEPWGVTRFFVRDPFGKLINILEHD